MTIDEEWNEYFGGAAFKSEHTVKSYKNSHKRITSYIGKPIAKGSVGELIEAVANLSENPNTQATLFNCILVFRTIAEKDNTKIWNAKKALQPEINAWRGIVASSKAQLTQAQLAITLKNTHTKTLRRETIIKLRLVPLQT